MGKLFYRFRSLENLLGKKELENQEIYFTDYQTLNNPMERFYDLVFNGDEIVWKNFFKHYLMCLEKVFLLFYINGEEKK